MKNIKSISTIKFIIVQIMCLHSIFSFGQINLEHEYQTRLTTIGQEFYLTDLGNNNFKYVIYDYDSAKFDLYNLDHTPFLLNVHIPVTSDPATNLYYRLGYISNSLFDCDSTNIEYAIMLDTPHLNAHPNFAVFRTDGTVLFSKDSVGTVFSIGMGSGSYEMHPIINTSDGAKLFLFNYDNQNSNLNTYVYDLCGELPAIVKSFNSISENIDLFPNPTQDKISFDFSKNENRLPSELLILNQHGQEIKKVLLDNIKLFTLSTEEFSNGIYFYLLKKNNIVLSSGKFVVTK